MLCENCGFKFEDSAAFCPQCGAPVQSQTNTQQTAQDVAPQVQSELLTTNQRPPKKSKKGLIIGIVAAVVAVIVALVAFSSSLFSNYFKKTFSSDKDYLKLTVQNSCSEFAENLGSFYEQLNVKETTVPSQNVEFEINLGKSGADFIGQILGMDVSWAKSAILDINAHFNDNKYSADTEIKLNDKKIVSLNYIIDMESYTMYMQIPEFNNEYVSLPFATDMEGAVSSQEMQKMLDDIISVLPDTDTLERIITRYVGIVFDCMEEVQKETVTLDVKGVSLKCDKYSVKLDGDFLVKAISAVFEEAKNDNDIKKIILDIAKLDVLDVEDADEFYGDYQASLVDAIQSIEESDKPEIEVTYNTWINNKGDIIGLEIEYGEFVFSYFNVEKGKDYAVEASIEIDGNKFSFEGEGKISGSKKSGKFVVKAMGMDFVEIEMKDFDTKSYEKGYANGTIEIKPSSAILLSMLDGVPAELSSFIGDLSLKLDLKSSEKEVDYKLSLYQDDDLLVDVGLSGSPIDNKKANIPSNSVSLDDGEALQKWAEKIDINKIINALKEAGLPAYLLPSF